MLSLHDINLKLKLKTSTMKIEQDLLKVKPLVDIKIIIETLTRIGVANKREKIIFPSCYIYKIGEDYYLCHFKQLFQLTRDNGYNNISRDDILRRNAIAFCLQSWHLIDVDAKQIEEREKFVFVLPHNEKEKWVIAHKFNINSVYSNMQAGEHARQPE